MEVSPGVVIARAPVRCATLDRPLRVAARQESIDQSRSKRIAAAHAVKNLQVIAILRLKEFTVVIADRAPIILRGGLGLTQSGSYNLKRVILHDFLDHLLKTLDAER